MCVVPLSTRVTVVQIMLAPPRCGAEPLGDRVRVVDLGLSFFVDRQFVTRIQTREYRSPESVLGVRSFTPASDVWSVACVVFELLTGTYLFDPEEGVGFSKDEAHLAQAVELLGPIPRGLVDRGGSSARAWFISGTAKLRNLEPAIPAHDALARVLRDNMQYTEVAAATISSFLTPMLCFDPDRRISAEDARTLDWLT